MPNQTNPENPTRKINIFSGTHSLLWRIDILILISTDFDGTIFMQDTGHVLVSNLGGGNEFLKKIQEQIKTGERSFREASEDMWGSLTIPIEDGFDTMKNNMSMDPKFKEFHEFCMENNISFNVISAGLRPILRKVLDAFLGAQEVSLYLLCLDVMAMSIAKKKNLCSLLISTSWRTTLISTVLRPGNLSGCMRQN